MPLHDPTPTIQPPIPKRRGHFKRLLGPRGGYRRWLPEASLALIVLILYAETIGYGYCKWNDEELVILTWREALNEAFYGLHVRPIWYFSYVITNSLGLSPHFDHVVNLILFIASAFLAHRVARVFLPERKRAFLVALTWILLPWNAYPASWIAQRNDLLIYVLGFLAILAFYRDCHGLSFLYLTGAVFSKVTVAFVPLFFVFKALRRRSWAITVCFTGLFLSYALLAFHNYVKYFPDGGGVGQLALPARVAVYPLHWLEHVFLLIVPLPFFVSYLQGFIYATGVVGLAVGCTLARRRQQAPGSRDLVAIALLTSALSLVSSELRICGFESLFWIILLVRHAENRKRMLTAISCALVLVAYVWGIQVTKPIFIAPENGTAGPRYFYPNGYYEVRKDAVLNLMRRGVQPGAGSTSQR